MAHNNPLRTFPPKCFVLITLIQAAALSKR